VVAKILNDASASKSYNKLEIIAVIIISCGGGMGLPKKTKQ
jgi:hypothetical protein